MTTSTKTKPVSLQTKFQNLGKEMRKMLVERDDEITIFQLALLARQHAFLYGSPGIAKSLLVEGGMKLIDGLDDGDYFSILMMKSTTREDVFGPLSLTALKDDRYAFLSDGYLPTAKVAFLDEIWKSNSAIQNALLWAANERKYRNDGKVHDIPLHSMFVASNEMPDGDELLAIYDRFLIRKIVNDINEPGSFIEMLNMKPEPVVPVLTWDEVSAAANEVAQVVVPMDVLDSLVELKQQLKEKEIYPSARRFKQSLSIVRAAAWLEGETEADIEHLQLLRFVLWDEVEHFNEVEKLCFARSNPIDLEVMKIQTDLSKLSSQLDKVIADGGDSETRQRQGAAIYEKVKLAKLELVTISEKLKGSKKKSAKLSGAAEQMQSLTKRMLTKIFDTSEEEIKEGLKEFSSFADDDADDE